MPFRRAQPTPDFLLTIARRTLAIHGADVAGNPIRSMVASGGQFQWSIERAAEWPFDCNYYIIGLVNTIMADHLHNGTPLADAVANVPRAR